jgi:hypothetical protein
MNAASIAELTSALAVLVSTVTPLGADVSMNSADIKTLMRRPVWVTAIVAIIPSLLTVLLWWFSRVK